jgi:eukaryotic-like serine/threonine-protein kinase
MNIKRFKKLLVDSRLSNEIEADELDTVFQEESHKQNIPATVEMFCDFLIARKLLTRWQCDKLRMGKYKGFYLDNYVMLEQSGKGADYASYKCRDARSGRLVTLFIKPINQTGGRIEYRVEPCAEE